MLLTACQVPLHITRQFMSVLLVLDKSLSFQLVSDKVASLEKFNS